jgi:hypothetical protein
VGRLPQITARFARAAELLAASFLLNCAYLNVLSNYTVNSANIAAMTFLPIFVLRRATINIFTAFTALHHSRQFYCFKLLV